MSEKRVPELRFKGFTEDWEQHKLKEIAKIVTGSTPKTSDKLNYIGEYLFASPVDIQENRYIEKTITTLTEKGFNSGRRVRKGASLFVSIGSTIGKVGQANTHLTTNQQINSVIGSKLVDDNFLYSSLFKESNKIKQLSATQAVPIINKTTFSNIGIFITNLEEQKQIGTFLKKLDDTIALHQDKLEKLKQLKKGYLQLVFPQKDKKTPQLRFAHFSSDWEQRKAKELFQPIVEKGQPELPLLSVTQDSGVVYRDQVGIDIEYDSTTLKNYKVIHPGDFVISLRSFQGGFEVSDKLGITSPAYTVFISKYSEEHDSSFWKTQFKTFKFIESLKTVTFGIRDGKSISFSEFGDLKLLYPFIVTEQQKIGRFFQQLDQTITLHRRKISTLQEIKKMYLKKMFV